MTDTAELLAILDKHEREISASLNVPVEQRNYALAIIGDIFVDMKPILERLARQGAAAQANSATAAEVLAIAASGYERGVRDAAKVVKKYSSPISAILALLPPERAAETEDGT